MKRLIGLLSQMDKNSKLITSTRDKRQREALISEDNFTRHEALSEVCRLYRNGAIQKADELLNGKVLIGVDLASGPDETTYSRRNKDSGEIERAE